MDWDSYKYGQGTRVDDQGIEQMKSEYPWLPQDYLDYLAQVGWGESCGVMFYSRPTTFADMGVVQGPSDFVAIADDMAGFHYGFVRSMGDRVIGVDSTDWMIEDQEVRFRDLMEELYEEYHSPA